MCLLSVRIHEVYGTTTKDQYMKVYQNFIPFFYSKLSFLTSPICISKLPYIKEKTVQLQ